ncbi:MAG: hypothetical protein NVSMB19_09790 [Vulcanimicrobiaceae bacterium]
MNLGRMIRAAFRMTAIALAVAALPLAASAADGDPALRGKLLNAFARVKSYRLTVLGAARSLGVWVAPNAYQMTTELGGKPVKTIIIGSDYWTFADGKWEHSGHVSSNLDVDIAGLLRNARANARAAFTRLPEQTQDGKRVGTFGYTFPNGTEETCNYDRATFRVTRCKADEVTLLYSAYNDPGNRVANPRR